MTSELDNELVKSDKDGRWYYRHTKWNYILDCLAECFGYFSEKDMDSELFKRFDSLAEDVSTLLCNLKNEC